MVINRMLRLARRELEIVWSDWRLVVLVFVMPFAYTILLGSLYLPKRVTEIPTYVIDQDNSALSREIVHAVDRHEYFNVTGRAASETEFRRAVIDRKAYVCVIIPPHFQSDIKKGKHVKLLGLVDGSNLLISNSAYKGVATIAGTYSTGVEMKKLGMRGTPGEYLVTNAMPIDTSVRVWYNPAFTYTDFIMPGLIAAVVQQIALLGVALAFTKEMSHGLVPTIFKITSSPLEVLATKGILYTSINMFTAFGAYSLIFLLFGVPLTGSVFLLALLLFVFIIALVALGLCVSVLCKDETFATEVLMLLSLPSFLLSGYTWPTFSMIPAIKAISYVFPLTHFVMPIRSVVAQGAGFATIRGEVLWMWSLAAISYVIAYVVIARVMAAAKRNIAKE